MTMILPPKKTLVLGLCLLAAAAGAEPGTNAPLAPVMQQLLQQAAVESDVAADAGFDPAVVAVGEPVTYRVVITSDPAAVDLPEPIAAPQELELKKGGVGGSFVSKGQTSQYLATFNYPVVTRGVGSFTINAFDVTMDNQAITVPARTLTVLPPGSPAARRPVTFHLEVPDGEFYVGQAIPVSLVAQDPGDSSLYGLVDPKVLGEAFLFDPVPGSQRRELREDDGQSISVQLTTINATPVHEGRLVLSAQTFIDARAGTDPGAIRLRGYRPFLEAAPVMIRVNHLPPGAPPGFSGLIGRFESATPAPAAREARAGDPFDLPVVVRGEGNLGRLIPPPIAEAPGWRVVTGGGAPPAAVERGTATFHYTLIPLQPGLTPTPKIPFSYFDPQAGHYADLTIPSVKIMVLSPAGGRLPATDTNGLNALAGTAGDHPAERLGNLAPQPVHFAASLVPVQQRPAFWLGQLGVGAVVAGWFGWDRRRRFLAAHPDLVRRARARRELRRQERLLLRAAANRDAAAFTRAAVASLRVAGAPHLSANAGALVCDDVLRALPAAERDGRSGRVVRQLFRVADELRLKGQAPNPQLLWSLQPELEILLTELRRRLC